MPDYKKLKENLQSIIDKKREEKTASEKDRQFRIDEDRTKILDGIGKDVAESLKRELAVLFKDLAQSNKLTTEELREAFDGVSFNIPSIKVPKAEVIVNVPPIKIPDIKVPEQKVSFPLKMKVENERGNPLNVILTDNEGRNYNIQQIISGGGGGLKIKQYTEADTDSLIKGLSVLGESNDILYPLQLGAGVSDRALRVVHAADSVDSVWVNGFSTSVSVMAIARQTNPTAVSDGDNQRIITDDLGRTLTRPIQVRDLTVTAYTTLTSGSETTLASAVAGSYLDLIYVMGANNSDVAVTVDLRAVTGGNIVMTMQIPANGTAGIACPVPLPQGDIGNNWTADMGDITGTTVFLTALFSKEI